MNLPAQVTRVNGDAKKAGQKPESCLLIWNNECDVWLFAIRSAKDYGQSVDLRWLKRTRWTIADSGFSAATLHR